MMFEEKLEVLRAEARGVEVLPSGAVHHAILMHRRDNRPLLGAEEEQAVIWREHPWVSHLGEAQVDRE